MAYGEHHSVDLMTKISSVFVICFRNNACTYKLQIQSFDCIINMLHNLCAYTNWPDQESGSKYATNPPLDLMAMPQTWACPMLVSVRRCNPFYEE